MEEVKTDGQEEKIVKRSAEEEQMLELVKVDECIYGDDLVRASLVGEEKDMPAEQMTCSSFMAYLIKSDKSPFAYCANSTFRSICCETCKCKYI